MEFQVKENVMTTGFQNANNIRSGCIIQFHPDFDKRPFRSESFKKGKRLFR